MNSTNNNKLQEGQNRVREVRQEQGLKAIELSAKSGVQPALLSRIENYPTLGVSDATKKKIAVALGVKVSAIFHVAKKARTARKAA